jgi:hypothetical protein
MITIEIDEFVNGYSLVGFDNKDGYFFNEINEDKLEVLEALKRWTNQEIFKELGKREGRGGDHVEV